MKMKRIVALFLTLSLISSLFTGLMTSAYAAGEFDPEFRAAIMGEPEWVNAYPGGLFNFLGGTFSIRENNEFYEIAVIRQGGTEGDVSVNFKAFDVTARYGEDYFIRVYSNHGKNQIEQNPDAELIMDFDELNDAIDLSGGIEETGEAETDGEITDTADPDAQGIDTVDTDEQGIDAANPDAQVDDTTEPDAQVDDAAEPDAQDDDATEPDAQDDDAADTDAQDDDATEPDAQVDDAADTDAQDDDTAEPDAQENEEEQSEPEYTDLPQKMLYNDEQISSSNGRNLSAIRETALGQESDRPDWQLMGQDDVEQLKSVYDDVFGQVEGTETTIEFADGEYIKYLYIIPVKSDVYKGERQAIFMLTDPNGAVRGDSYMAQVNIIDDKEAPKSGFAISPSEITLSPEDTEVTLTVSRSDGIAAATVVQVGTAGDTAVMGADYADGTQTILFPAGVSEKQVKVRILPNESRVNARKFAVMIDAPEEDIIQGAGYAEVTIPGNKPESIQTESFQTESFQVSASTMDTSTSRWVTKDITGKAEIISKGGRAAYAYEGTAFGMNYSGQLVKGRWLLKDLKNLFKIGKNEVTFTDTSLRIYGDNSKSPINTIPDLEFYGVNTISYVQSLSGATGNEYGYVAINTTHYNYGYIKSNTMTKDKINIDGKIDVPPDYWRNFELIFDAVGKSEMSYYVNNIVLDLTPFTVTAVDSDKVPVYEYTLNSNGQLVRHPTPHLNKAPIKLKFSGVDSNVGNTQSFSESSNITSVTAYRSDFIGVSYEIDLDYENIVQFGGLEYRAVLHEESGAVYYTDWQKHYNSDNGILLDAFLFRSLPDDHRIKAQEIQVRPMYYRYKVADSSRPLFIEYKYSPDKGTGIIGIGSSANSNDPREKRFTNDVGFYRGDILNLTIERGNSILLPHWGLYENFIISSDDPTDTSLSRLNYKFTLTSTLSADIKLDLTNPSLKVMAFPDTYAHRVNANGTYSTETTIPSITFPPTLPTTEYKYYSPTERQKFVDDMTEIFERGGNPDVTIKFGYTWDDIVGRDNEGNLVNAQKNNESRTLLGNIPDAVFTVYDSSGNVRKAPITLKPTGGSYPDNLNATYEISGSLKDLGWQRGDYATVYFVGSNQVFDFAQQKDVPVRTLETKIDFVSSTAGTVVVSHSSPVSSGAAQIGAPYTVTGASLKSPYNIYSLTQNGMVSRWLDGSHDIDNDGINDISTNKKVFYGNSFSFSPQAQGINKLYFDFKKMELGAESSAINIKLMERTYKAINSKTKVERPAAGAKVILFGQEIGTTDENGNFYFQSYGLIRGQSYLLEIIYFNNRYNVVAEAGSDQNVQYLDVGSEMQAILLPDGITQATKGYKDLTDWVHDAATITKRTIPYTTNAAVLDTNEHNSYGLTFDFAGGGNPHPNTAILKVYKRGEELPVYESAPIYRGSNVHFTMSDDQYFTPKTFINARDIDDYEMVISAQYRTGIGGSDEIADYVYPDMPTGITFSKPSLVTEFATSFSSNGPSNISMIGNVNQKFGFGLRVNTDQMKFSRYVLDNDGRYSLKPKLSFGVTLNKVSDNNPHLINVPTKEIYETTSEPNAPERIIYPNIAPPIKTDKPEEREVTEAKIAKELFDGEGPVADRGAKVIGMISGVTDKGVPVPSGSGMDSAGFGFQLDVGVELVFDIPFVDDGYGHVQQSGRMFFDSLSMTVTAVAEYANKMSAVTPVGIPIFFSFRVGGQATAVVGWEAKYSDNYLQAYEYDSSGKIVEINGKKQYYYVYEIDEDGMPMVYSKVGTGSVLFSADDYFDEYARLLLYPYGKLSAGVGVDLFNAYVSGAAVFDFEFKSPDHSSADKKGSGGVTLDVSFGIKVLFITKEWAIARQHFDFFEYGGSRAAQDMMMASLDDPYRNYLYEDMDNFEVAPRDYLSYRNSGSGGLDRMSAYSFGGNSGDIIGSGMYPNPQTRLVELGGGKLFMVFVDDVNGYEQLTQRSEYNRCGVFYTVYDGTSWTTPALVHEIDDGTWDDYPDAFIVEDKVLVTYSNSDRTFDENTGAAEVMSSSNIAGRWFTMNGSPAGSQFDITWTSDKQGGKVTDFSGRDWSNVNCDGTGCTNAECYHNVYDMFGDSRPKTSYDPDTGRLMVYYVKTDYISTGLGNSLFGQDDDATLVGDIINAYSVIAYRTAEKNVNTGGDFTCAAGFTWQDETSYSPGDEYSDGFYGQRLLDLAVLADIEERVVTETVTETFEYDNDGTIETAQLSMPRNKVEQTVSPAQNPQTDPRVIASDVISYNGLALYAYTMDDDADLKTTYDQNLYMQIYNYSDSDHGGAGTFTHPIQLTNNTASNTNPQFVRVNNVTYLYFISGGDVKYIDISELVATGGLKAANVNGSTIYIVDKSNYPSLEGYIITAVPHDVNLETGEEHPISEFKIRADNEEGAVYLIWSVYMDAQKEDAKDISLPESYATSKVICAAYSKPALERDPSTGEFVRNDDFYDWSRPVVITPEIDGTCYTDLDFVVNGHDDLTITYLKYREKDYKLDIGPNREVESSTIEPDMTDLSSTALSYGRYLLSGNLEVGETIINQDRYAAGDRISFSADITNTGIKPINDIWVKAYAKQNGQYIDVISGPNEPVRLNGYVSSLTGKPLYSYQLGGVASTVQTTMVLPDDIRGIEVGFEVWTEQPAMPTVPAEFVTKTELKTEQSFYIDSVTAELLSKEEGEIKFELKNTGNLPFDGKVRITHADTKEQLVFEDVSAAAFSVSEYFFEIAIDENMFTVKSAEGEDGTVYDAVPLRIDIIDQNGNVLDGEEHQGTVESMFAKTATAKEASAMNNISAFSISGGNTVAPKSTLQLAESIVLKTPISEEEIDIVEVWWSSDSETIRVDGNGVVTATKDANVGDKATITAYAKPRSFIVTGNFDGSFEFEENFDMLPDSMIKTAQKSVTVTAEPVSPPPTGGGSYPITVNKPTDGEQTDDEPSDTPTAPSAWKNPSEFINTYSDIKEDAWYYDDVAFVAANGLFKGVSETEFAPGSTMTRAMLVTVMHRLAGVPEVNTSGLFTDVGSETWYSGAVEWAAENGIVSGKGENLFDPDSEITREETAVIIYRFAKYLGFVTEDSEDDLNFEDTSDTSDWAEDAVKYCVKNGIITGKPGNLFDPQGMATRAEMAAMLHRFIISVNIP